MLPGVFAQIPLNLQKPFTLWNETTYYFFKVICPILRSRGPKKIIVKHVKFGVSRHFVENTQEEWLEIWHAGVVWPPSKLIDFGHGLFICLILTLSWLVKQVRFAVSIQAFSGECMGGMAWNLACWYIQSTSRSDYIMIMVYWFYSFLVVLWPSETSQICGFRAGQIWTQWNNALKEWPEIWHADVSWPPSD